MQEVKKMQKRFWSNNRKVSYDERRNEKRYVRCCLRWFERVT